MTAIDIPENAKPETEHREVEGRVHLFVRAEGVTAETLERIGVQPVDGWADLGAVSDPATLGRHLLVALSNLCIVSNIASPQDIAPDIDGGGEGGEEAAG